jgi:hypothetical protein
MRRPPEDLDRDIFAQSRARPESTPSDGLADAGARRTRHGRRGMIHYGVMCFTQGKAGVVFCRSIHRLHAAMRGGTRAAFRKARAAQGSFSVAGTDAKTLDWDRKQPGSGS